MLGVSYITPPLQRRKEPARKKGLAEYGKFLANRVFAIEKALFPRGELSERMGVLELRRTG
jgi:hypothetical protein